MKRRLILLLKLPVIVALAILAGIWFTLWLIKSAIWPPGGRSVHDRP